MCLNTQKKKKLIDRKLENNEWGNDRDDKKWLRVVMRESKRAKFQGRSPLLLHVADGRR